MIYTLLVAHFIGDFVCQSDWMALNKGRRMDALALHVAVYAGVLAVCLAAVFRLDAYSFALFISFNAVMHFMQDAFTSRLTSWLWFYPKVGEGMRPAWIQVEVRQTRHWFFVAIGADQFLHYVLLAMTAQRWLQ